MNIDHPIIVTITGPSGSGKTVLSNLLKDEGLMPLVSTTTRAPRQGEQDGVDYNFVSREQFLQDQKDGKFIENVEYNGILYGVSVEEAERAFSAQKPAILVAEPHGVEQIKEFAERKGWNALRVFVDNPENILLGRLLNRLLMDVTGHEIPDQQINTFAPWVEKLQSIARQDPTQLPVVLGQFLDAHGNNSTRAPDTDKRIGAAAHRLKSFQFEQDNWVIPAREGKAKYEFITESFDQHVQNDVLQEIIRRVEAMPAPAPKSSGIKF